MRRALIIDDSPATRRFFERILTELGWTVTAAENAEKGAASALTAPPSLVISDMRMPGLSGLQLCRLLREDPITAHVPIVLVSATLDKRTRYWALQSGASAVISKEQATELPKLLDLLQFPDARTEAGGPISAGSIPTRLSHLLDQSLYESVVAKDLRGLALAADSREFFQGLTQLLLRVSDYQWLALVALQGPNPTGCAHVHVESKPRSIEEVAHALPLADMGLTIKDFQLTTDTRCLGPNSPSAEIEVYPISIAGVRLGYIAVKPDAHADNKAFFAFVANELAPALRSVILTEEARRLALTDALTGLWNRRCAAETLTQCLAAAHRYHSHLSLAMIDIDLFKRINDNHGHHSGDLALQHVAKLLQRAARKADITARWGGEEFIFIMPSTGSAGARVAAERVRMSIADNPVTLHDGTVLRITASIGIATLKEKETESELVNRADQALYLAKERGRNRVEQG